MAFSACKTACRIMPNPMTSFRFVITLPGVSFSAPFGAARPTYSDDNQDVAPRLNHLTFAESMHRIPHTLRRPTVRSARWPSWHRQTYRSKFRPRMVSWMPPALGSRSHGSPPGRQQTYRVSILWGAEPIFASPASESLIFAICGWFMLDNVCAFFRFSSAHSISAR